MGETTEGKVVAQNKKARHDYFIEETFEAGIVLTGTEIKSIRAGKMNLKDSFARIKNGEAFCTMPTLVNTNKATATTMNRHGRANCCSIKNKSIH